MATDEVNQDILPIVYDIIRGSIERDILNDSSPKPRESFDNSQKLQELRTKLQQCREHIQKLPGINYSKEDQLKQLEALRKQLILKQELLTKYKNMCHFDAPKI